MSTPLLAGTARATVTPPVGIDLSGFAGREAAVGLHDDLLATALVFAEGDDRFALLCCDLLFVEAEFVKSVREECARRTGIPEGRIGISCSHTHYGPSTNPAAEDADVQAYLAVLKFLLAGVVQEAAANLAPVRVGVGWGSCDIGINRRERKPDGRIVLGQNPEGPVDRAVAVVRIDDADGAPLAVLGNFACHGVCQSSQTRLISADYPGAARQLVERAVGAPFLFAQGAGANINPIRMEPCYEPARTLGTRLGCEVVRVWETICPEPVAGLKTSLRQLNLPALTFASLDEGQAAVADLSRQLEDAQAAGAGKGALHWLNLRLERARAAVESLETGVPLPPLASEVQVLRVGSLAFCLTPGEIFCELGQAVRQQSPLPHTLFLAYSNGSLGYVPTAEAYLEGGYEVTHACRVGPQAGGLLVAECHAALVDCQ